MELSSEHMGNICILTIPDETLTAGNVRSFKTEMEAFMTPNAEIILDLSHLRFIDSSGIGSIISVMKKIESSGGKLKLCSLSKTVNSVFDLVKINLLVDICETREDAVKLLNNSHSLRAQQSMKIR